MALGVPNGWEGGKGRLGMGRASLKALPGLILCPTAGPYWAERAEGGDALQALRYVGSMGTCPWAMPPEICRSIPGGMPKGVQPQRWDKLSGWGGGCGTIARPQLGSWCWGRGGVPFSTAAGWGMKRQTAPGDVGPRGGPCPCPPPERRRGRISTFPPTVHLPRSVPRDQGRKIPRRAVPRVSGCSRGRRRGATAP